MFIPSVLLAASFDFFLVHINLASWMEWYRSERWPGGAHNFVFSRFIVSFENKRRFAPCHIRARTFHRASHTISHHLKDLNGLDDPTP